MKKKGCLGCLGVLVGIIILFAIIAIFAGGSDSKTASTDDKQTQQEAKPEKKDGLTYEKFVNIKMGSTYEEVKAAAGKDGDLQSQVTVGDIDTKSYMWNDGTANMSCTFQNGKLINKAMASLQNLVKIGGENIKLAQFEQIQPGMPYEDVKKVLGRDGFLLSQSNIMGMEATIYSWMNSGGANLNVSFSDGVVASKAQFGLK